MCACEERVVGKDKDRGGCGYVKRGEKGCDHVEDGRTGCGHVRQLMGH